MSDDDALVFKALADPTRRLLLDRLFERDGRTLGDLEAAVEGEVAMTRFGVMKHLRVLEAAGLVVTRRRGREKLHFLNPVPIRLIHDRWIDKYTEPRVSALVDLKHRLEEGDAPTPVRASASGRHGQAWETARVPELTPEQLQAMLDAFYPYKDELPVHASIPAKGLDRDEVLAQVAELSRREDVLGDSGKVSGSLYLGDHEQYAFLTEVFSRYAHANVLQRDMYPSATKFEGEIVAMTARMLHADAVPGHHPGEQVSGLVTSGGTESLIEPMLVYRERGRARGITAPEVIVPDSAHVALDKACHYFGIRLLRAPLREDFRVDLDWVRAHVTESTVALVGSAGSYPYGLVDPIEELAAIAQEHDLGLHVDGCLGGFLLPWIERTGVDVPLWDFRVPGVTSISADTHKFGYALKGTSVLMYRNADLRRLQYFTFPDWPGGLYVSPGMAGSRSGGLIAAAWAALLTTGEEGYLEAAEAIHRTAQEIKAAVQAQPELRLFGDGQTFLVAFGAARAPEDGGIDIFLVNDALAQRGWRMNPDQLPPGLHFCVTRPNTRPGLTQEFARDLGAAVAYAVEHRGSTAASGALYGFAGTPGGNDVMRFLMSGALDAMYSLPPGVAPAAD